MAYLESANDDLTTLIEYGPRTPEGFTGHAIRFNPADVARWAAIERNAPKAAARVTAK